MLTWLWQLTGRLRASLRQSSFDRDFDQALESHLEMRGEELQREGMTPEQARRAARFELGGATQLREAHREVRGLPLFPALLQDVRYALRGFRKAPGFMAAALSALALGIGATTAIFSIVNSVLLKPLPVNDADRFVILMTSTVNRNGDRVSGPAASPAKYEYLRRQTSVLEDISALGGGVMNYTGGDVAEQLTFQQDSADIFKAFGIPILLGRSFTSSEDSPGGPHVALISQELWTTHFGSDPQIVGKLISLNGEPYTILGVVAFNPAWLEWGPAPAVFVPSQIDPNTTDIGNNRFQVFARLKPGVTLKQANAELQAATGAYRAKFPGSIGPKDSFMATTYKQYLIGDTRPLLWVLLGAVGLVLLIACANVANLLLVRTEGRWREIAIRSAIGAGRGRMIRQMLTESLLLSAAGGALGSALGYIGIRALLAVNTAGLPRVGNNGIAVDIDWRLLAFALGISLLTGVVFGLVPALRGSRADLNAALKDSGGRTGSGLRQNKARSALVMSELGLAVVLLVGSALLIRTFMALYAVDPGFDTKNVLQMRTLMTGQKYEKTGSVADTARDGLERIRALPGVVQAAAAYAVPLEGGAVVPFNIAGRAPVQGSFSGAAAWSPVSPGFFEALKIPMKRGRAFNDHDDSTSPPVAIIDEMTAKLYWKNGNPLKDRIVLGRGIMQAFDGEPARRIIGIVGGVRSASLNRGPVQTIYVPESQLTEAEQAFVARAPLGWLVRTRNEPNALIPAIREQVRRATGLPVTSVRSMDEVMSLSTARQRFNMLLMSVFGCAALLLAAIGIYGLMAYIVEQRTREIGIRLALGAEARQIRKRIVLEGMRLAKAGVGAGIGAASGLSRFLASFLFGVKARDPIVFVAVPVVLGAVALFAVWLPARRASRIDPIQALRYE